MRRVGRSLLLLSCGLSAPRAAAWTAPALRAHPALPLTLRPGAVGAGVGQRRAHKPTACDCGGASGAPPAAAATGAVSHPILSPAILSVNPHLDASLPFRNLAFYIISPVQGADDVVEDHRAFLARRQMVGRVYICADGINAQVSGTADQCAEYRAFCHAGFGAGADSAVLFKEDPVAQLSYPRLRVKHRGLVPNTGGPAAVPQIDLSNRGTDLTPAEWQAMLDGAEAPVVLDVRNDYEWDVGRFAAAGRPAPTRFAQSDEAAYGLPEDADRRAQTPVMMYCTGGIRCEYFSARLKAQGFQKVYKLKGGIQHYGNSFALRQEAPPHWEGSLFVFDRRNTVSLGGTAPRVVGTCLHCGSPTESFVNCGNIDCNKLHLVCAACLPRTAGFCSQPCSAAPRRRPLTDPTATQGAPPGEADPNRLSAVKPHNVGRKDFDVDTHGYRTGQQG